jgi:hypothetical protein
MEPVKHPIWKARYFLAARNWLARAVGSRHVFVTSVGTRKHYAIPGKFISAAVTVPQVLTRRSFLRRNRVPAALEV